MRRRPNQTRNRVFFKGIPVLLVGIREVYRTHRDIGQRYGRPTEVTGPSDTGTKFLQKSQNCLALVNSRG